jgi:hypothetical protein
VRRKQSTLRESGLLSIVPSGRSFDQRFTSVDVKGMPEGIDEVIAEYRDAKPSST